MTLGVISYLPSLKITSLCGSCKPQWFPKPAKGAYLPDAGSQDRGSQCGAKQLFFFRKDSQAHDVPLLSGSPAGHVSPD